MTLETLLRVLADPKATIEVDSPAGREIVAALLRLRSVELIAAEAERAIEALTEAVHAKDRRILQLEGCLRDVDRLVP